MTIQPWTLKRQAAAKTVAHTEFPAAAAVLLVVMAVAALAIGVGVRWGLIWGLVAGFVGWGSACSLTLVCACIAGARHSD